MIFEGILVILLVGALLMVIPSILDVVQASAPQVGTANPELVASQNIISGITTGGLNIAGIGLFGIAIFLIAGTVILRGGLKE